MTATQWTAVVAIAVFIVDFVIRVAAIIIIPRDRRPSSAMAWLLAIFLIPYIGIIFFLVLGTSKLPPKRRARQKQIDGVIASKLSHLSPDAVDTSWPPWFANVVTMNSYLGSTPLTGHNEAHLMGDYEGSIAAMTDDVNAATRFVHVEFYIVSFDKTTAAFFAAMGAAVERGVTVRLLMDHIASIRTVGHKATIATLDELGVQWAYMLPVQPLKGKYQRPDLRNHRKIVVIDGTVGYLGSQNLIDRSYNSAKNLRRGLQWQELMTRITGPTVSVMNAIFLGDWFSETDEVVTAESGPSSPRGDYPVGRLDCQVVPSGPGYETENNLRLFLALLYSAQERVIITSPYFVPDESMLYAITSARQRGLEVQLFVSEIGDQGPVWHAQRSYYGALLRSGVRIWLYPAPFILHAKHFSVDDDIAVIGSSNMDIRSFSLDLEVSLLVRGRSFVDEMREVEATYRQVSRELTLAEWQRRPLWATVLDGLGRLTSALE